MSTQIRLSLVGILCLVLVSALLTACGQTGGSPWEGYNQAGMDAHQQGNYAEAEKQFLAALPLAPEIVAVLQEWLSQAKYRTETDWVFASEKGGLRDGDKLREKFLKAGADRAGIGKIGWHTLRHSFATALDVAGARMKVAQELMRHANIATTMDVYTGVMERDKRKIAGQVAKAFLGSLQ